MRYFRGVKDVRGSQQGPGQDRYEFSRTVNHGMLLQPSLKIRYEAENENYTLTPFFVIKYELSFFLKVSIFSFLDAETSLNGPIRAMNCSVTDLTVAKYS